MVSDEAIWTFTLLNLADVSTTLIALKRGAYELNPIARWFIEKLGIKSLFALKYGLMSLMLFYSFMLGEPIAEMVIWIWNIVLGGVVAWNSYINAKLVYEEIKAGIKRKH